MIAAQLPETTTSLVAAARALGSVLAAAPICVLVAVSKRVLPVLYTIDWQLLQYVHWLLLTLPPNRWRARASSFLSMGT